MIVGIGTDLVGVVRFERALSRTPLLLERVFTEAERSTPTGQPRRPRSLAARFAAKEAAAKALGAPRGWGWHVSLTHDADLAAAIVIVESCAARS